MAGLVTAIRGVFQRGVLFPVVGSYGYSPVLVGSG